jgi:hypothetical protein
VQLSWLFRTSEDRQTSQPIDRASGVRRGRGWVAVVVVLAVGVASPAVAAGASGERVYEMVSPVEKMGNQAGLSQYGSPMYSRPSADGDAIVYYTTGPVGDAVRGLQFYTLGKRTADGWSARAAIPGPEPGITINAVGHGSNNLLISDDAMRIAFRSMDPQLMAIPPRAADNAFGSMAAYVTTADGPIGWLTKPVAPWAEPRPPQLLQPNQAALAGGSPDLSTVFFTYCGTLVDEDLPRLGRQHWGFYVSENGHVSSAGRLPDGTLDPEGAQQPGAGVGSQGCMDTNTDQSDPSLTFNPVSEDGTRATFLSPALEDPQTRPSQAYQYRKGKPSVLVTRSEITGQPSLNGVTAVAGSRSGSYIVFNSLERLTADTPLTPDIPRYYRFDTATQDLVRLDGMDGTPPADAQHGPELAGRVLAVADDGSVLFQLEGDPVRLVLWRDGQVLPVGTFTQGSIGEHVSMHVSSDNSTFVFQAANPFEGGSSTHQPGSVEVYRYVVGQTGPPTCISCVAAGQTSEGDALINPRSGGGQVWAGMTLNDVRNVSPDGKWVFFETRNGLVTRDTNGRRDVYEWADGAVSLISTGQSTRDVGLIDSSVSGDSVFFATSEGIDPRDVDDAYDVYVARVGGGFGHHEQVACEGDGCQAPAGPALALAPPVSVSFTGGGNVDGGSVEKPSVSVPKAKTVRGSRAKVRVTVPGAGRIAWSGSGVLKGRRTATKAAGYTVSVGLTAKARRTLARRGTVEVTVRVVFTPQTGRSASASVPVTFKHAKAKRQKAKRVTKAGR